MQDVLDSTDDKQTLMDMLEQKRWQTIGHTPRRGDELHSLIVEWMVEGTCSRGRPRTNYIGQITKNGGASVGVYEEFKNVANDRENWSKHFIKTNLWIVKKKKKSR